MEFIDIEATEDSQENQSLVFSDDDEETTNDEINNFIDDSELPREDVSFYRKLGPDNLHHYHKFPNHTIDPRIATYKNDELYFAEEDQQPELYRSENRDRVELINFLALKNPLQNSKEP